MDTSLYARARDLFDAGDEGALRVFVAEHFAEFPEDVQADLALLFFEESAERHASAIIAATDFLSESASTLNELDQLRQKIKERIGN